MDSSARIDMRHIEALAEQVKYWSTVENLELEEIYMEIYVTCLKEYDSLFLEDDYWFKLSDDTFGKPTPVDIVNATLKDARVC